MFNMKKFLTFLLIFIVIGVKAQTYRVERPFYDRTGMYLIQYNYKHKKIISVKVYKHKRRSKFKLLAIYRKPYPVLTDAEYIMKSKY